MKTRTSVILPDTHLGSQDKAALRVALKIIEHYSPERVVYLGDMLEVHSASSHGSSDRREELSATYIEELRDCVALLDLVEDMPGVVEQVFIEGNHEQRVERWAMSMGRFAKEIVDLISPKTVLSKGRKHPFTWVPYKNAGTPGVVELAPGLFGCHGWSTAKHAAHAHLRRAGGFSVIHGHTHRRQSYAERNPITNAPIEARSPGCLAKLQPLWVNSPTVWTHGVCVLQEVGDQWSLFTIPIDRGTAILPNGLLINAGAEDSVLAGVA